MPEFDWTQAVPDVSDAALKSPGPMESRAKWPPRDGVRVWAVKDAPVATDEGFLPHEGNVADSHLDERALAAKVRWITSVMRQLIADGAPVAHVEDRDRADGRDCPCAGCVADGLWAASADPRLAKLTRRITRRIEANSAAGVRVMTLARSWEAPEAPKLSAVADETAGAVRVKLRARIARWERSHGRPCPVPVQRDLARKFGIAI